MMHAKQENKSKSGKWHVDGTERHVHKHKIFRSKPTQHLITS